MLAMNQEVFTIIQCNSAIINEFQFHLRPAPFLPVSRCSNLEWGHDAQICISDTFTLSISNKNKYTVSLVTALVKSVMEFCDRQPEERQARNLIRRKQFSPAAFSKRDITVYLLLLLVLYCQVTSPEMEFNSITPRFGAHTYSKRRNPAGPIWEEKRTAELIRVFVANFHLESKMSLDIHFHWMWWALDSMNGFPLTTNSNGCIAIQAWEKGQDVPPYDWAATVAERL